MQDRPTAGELIAAVRHFLEAEILPIQTDPRVRFRTRVAANALTVLERELSTGSALAEEEADRLRALLQLSPSPSPPAGDHAEQSIAALRREVARRIRSGQADNGPWRQAVFAATSASVRAKLSISNPRLLESSARR